MRNLSQDTILNHLEKLCAQNDVSLAQISYLKPPPDRFHPIATAFQKTNTTLLNPVKEILGDSYTYPELRLTRLFLKN